MIRVLAIVLAGGGMLAACAGPAAVSDRIASSAIPADSVSVTPFGPEFGDARAVRADPRGRLYVADAGEDVVHRLLVDGEPLTSLGGPGSGDYAFLSPSGLDPTNGLTLYVADAGNGRIQRFSHEDRLLESVPVPADPLPLLGRRSEDPDRGRPVAVAAAPSGEVFAIEETRGVVLMWNNRRSLERVIGHSGDGRGALRRPVDLALTHDGRLLVADAGHDAVLVYDAYGEFLRRIADGLASDIRGVDADQDRIAVFLPDRVLLYDLEGMLERAFIVEVPEPLTGGTLLNGGVVLLTRARLYRPGEPLRDLRN